MWRRKVVSGSREDFECSILFFQHKWMCLYHQWQPCSGRGSMVGELRPALRSWEDSARSRHFASGHRNRKLGRAQSKSAAPALNFPLRATILHWSGIGAKVKRQSLGCVTKVLFKGDRISRISSCLIFPPFPPQAPQKVNTVHVLRQRSCRAALHPFLRMCPMQSNLYKDHVLNWEVRVTLPHTEARNLSLRFL